MSMVTLWFEPPSNRTRGNGVLISPCNGGIRPGLVSMLLAAIIILCISSSSSGTPFRYKKTTFLEPSELGEEGVEEGSRKENGDCRHVTLEDGCEVIEQETIMKLYEEVTTPVHSFKVKLCSPLQNCPHLK